MWFIKYIFFCEVLSKNISKIAPSNTIEYFLSLSWFNFDHFDNANESSDKTEIFVLVNVSLACKTVSGPNPGRDCIFPFKWNGQTFNSCPVDSDDKSKWWCSTKVDSNGNHVPNQNEYGHCGSSCPAHIDTSQSPTQSKFYLDLFYYFDYPFLCYL